MKTFLFIFITLVLSIPAPVTASYYGPDQYVVAKGYTVSNTQYQQNYIQYFNPAMQVSNQYPQYYMSSYNQPPTCPMNSYFDGTSRCVCIPGYALGSGLCRQEKYVCEHQIGLMSYFNNVSQSCQCAPGYQFNGSYCANIPVVANTSYGYQYSYEPYPFDNSYYGSIMLNTR